MESPAEIYEAIKDKSYSFLLESPNADNKLEKFSFIGFDPACIIESRGLETKIIEGNKEIVISGNPFDVLRETLNRFEHLSLSDDLRFSGGAVGYVSYNAGRFIERLPDLAKDDLSLPDLLFIIPGKLIILDHLNNKVFSNCQIPTPSKKLTPALPLFLREGDKGGEFQRLRHLTSNMTKHDFESIVLKAKEYIKNGDIYQVNLSQRFKAEIGSDPFEIYKALRALNPSPFASYLNFGGLKLISCSPERLILLEDGIAQTRPIAGTRPRGKNEHEDARLKGELLLNEKERAEHIMLVDLERNDIGRVCEYDTVKVDEMMTVEKYSHVMHIVSNVTGKLKSDKDQFDLFKAVFPGGTITGCPKIRSMEIIEELEPLKRGPYTGTIGYFGFNGNMDMSITIRTIVIKGKRAFAQVGAGIVVDSVPEFEYYETINKGKALFEAIRIAEGAESVNLV